MATIQDFRGRPVNIVRHDASMLLPSGCSVMNDPSRLDRFADADLFAGHYGAAERLSHRAAELRGRQSVTAAPPAGGRA